MFVFAFAQSCSTQTTHGDIWFGGCCFLLKAAHCLRSSNDEKEQRFPKSDPELQITEAFDLVSNADLCRVLTIVPQKKRGDSQKSHYALRGCW